MKRSITRRQVWGNRNQQSQSIAVNYRFLSNHNRNRSLSYVIGIAIEYIAKVIAISNYFMITAFVIYRIWSLHLLFTEYGHCIGLKDRICCSVNILNLNNNIMW